MSKVHTIYFVFQISDFELNIIDSVRMSGASNKDELLIVSDDLFVLDPVVDQVPPTITCPNDVVTTSSQATWPNPTATDNVDTSPDILCRIDSGSTFPLGVTTVECAATDAAGNSAVCSFTVTRGKFCGICLECGWIWWCATLYHCFEIRL